ncbi:MAG: hypothetical protein HYR62_03340 [Actinobacteria bacterium]|nr:hypothetical protein [Actinomycetota bacterium]
MLSASVSTLADRNPPATVQGNSRPAVAGTRSSVASQPRSARADIWGAEDRDHAQIAVTAFEVVSGTTYLHLLDAPGAAEMLDRAVARRSALDAKGRALLVLDLAACRVIENDPEEACRLVEQALEMARDSMVRPILARARAVRSDMGGWAGLPTLASLDAQLARVGTECGGKE